ncbi:hypothetical protein ACVIHF_007734 [Bradyrhizobium sp. USDA 4506]
MLQWHSFRFASAIELDIDPFEHGIQILTDLRIPEPDDAISFPLQPLLSRTIALRHFIVIVVSTVQLDDESLGRAEEIDDVRANRCLPSKMRSVRWQLSQRAPQDSFMRRRVGAQLFAAALRIDVETICVASPHPDRTRDAAHRARNRPSPSRGG